MPLHPRGALRLCAVTLGIALLAGCSTASKQATPAPVPGTPAASIPAADANNGQTPAAPGGKAVGKGNNPGVVLVDGLWQPRSPEEKLVFEAVVSDVSEDLKTFTGLADPKLIKSWEKKDPNDVPFGFGVFAPKRVENLNVARIGEKDGVVEYRARYDFIDPRELPYGAMATIYMKNVDGRWVIQNFTRYFAKLC